MLAVCASHAARESLNIPPVDLTWTLLYDAAGEWNHDTPLNSYLQNHLRCFEVSFYNNLSQLIRSKNSSAIKK